MATNDVISRIFDDFLFNWSNVEFIELQDRGQKLAIHFTSGESRQIETTPPMIKRFREFSTQFPDIFNPHGGLKKIVKVKTDIPDPENPGELISGKVRFKTDIPE